MSAVLLLFDETNLTTLAIIQHNVSFNILSNIDFNQLKARADSSVFILSYYLIIDMENC